MLVSLYDPNNDTRICSRSLGGQAGVRTLGLLLLVLLLYLLLFIVLVGRAPT